MRDFILPAVLLAALPSLASAQLSVDFTFDPSMTGGSCGLTGSQDVWVYGCFAAELDHYASDGTYLGSIPRPGSSANDVDIDIVTSPMTLSGTAVPAGSILFFDGESGACEVYAIDPTNGALIASLATTFGNSHVVGGAYCALTDQLVLMQDGVPAAAVDNLVAYVDPDTGTINSTFETDVNGFSINFGDLDVSTATGTVYAVSSSQNSIAAFTSAGAVVAEYSLPSGVGGLSGLGLDDATGGAWVCSSSGTVWHLRGLLEIGTPYCGPAVANSTGMPALARAFGTEVRSENEVRLVAFQLPQNSFGYFLNSRTQGFAMNPGGSQGNICLGGSVGRYNGGSQIFNSTSVGRGELDLDLGTTPTPTGFISVMAGESWNFQAWYRDANPSPTSNFTDAVEVTFL